MFDERRRADRTAGDGVVRAALIGLGKLGLDVAEGLLDRRDVEIVAAVDVDPAKAGRDIAELLGRRPIGVPVTPELSGTGLDCDVAVLMTASRMEAVADPIAALLERGINVLTSAEELAYPWAEFPEASRRLDALARERGVSVLGAGANPGFLMDVVPVVLSLASQDVCRLHITRTMDLRPHRAQRLTRFGLGETPERFDELPSTTAHGHIGFRQSIDAVADALGIELERVEQRPLRPTVVAQAPRHGQFVTIEAGGVAVVSQGAVGVADGEAAISLEEHFGFLEGGDDVPRGDSYLVEGADQQFTVDIRPGVLSFVTTPAVLINMLTPLVAAAPGLRSTVEFPVRELASKGRRRDRPRRGDLASAL